MSKTNKISKNSKTNNSKTDLNSTSKEEPKWRKDLRLTIREELLRKA